MARRRLRSFLEAALFWLAMFACLALPPAVRLLKSRAEAEPAPKETAPKAEREKLRFY